MKKIVDGLLYDTDKAELIYFDDVKDRTLYRAENGHFFTFYRNGQIIPRTDEAVKAYLGQRDVNKYIELFGNVEGA